MAKHYHSLVFIFLFFTATYAQTTAIPDANFEQALIDLGIDTDNTINQSVATADISGVTYLNVSSKNISDLTGIEDFVSLTSLYCFDNQLTSLNVTKNTALTFLQCYYNQITSIDVTKNTALTFLNFNGNQLTSIDVSQNTLVTTLGLFGNQLTSLDISKNTALTYIQCQGNQLTNLDVTNNTALINLKCNTNQLTSLDLSNNTALTTLNCSFNPLLTSLNVKNGYNSLITDFYAQNNTSLACIQVDNETAANAAEAPYTTWLKDASCIYSEDCAALSLDDDFLSQVVNVYPNPIHDILTIDSEVPLTKVEVYSVFGQKITEIYSGFKNIATDNLSSGMYIFKIYSENGTSIKKLIKN